jgi:hypothetical protein
VPGIYGFSGQGSQERKVLQEIWWAGLGSKSSRNRKSYFFMALIFSADAFFSILHKRI